MSDTKIIATLVQDDDRMDMLPKHFSPRHMMMAENMIYTFMGRLCDTYSGGFWQFYELSNGGFFMAPSGETKLDLAWEGNYYSGTVSPEAAGIIACLFAYNNMIWKLHGAGDDAGQETFARLEELLKEYVDTHPEGAAIFSAID